MLSPEELEERKKQIAERRRLKRERRRRRLIFYILLAIFGVLVASVSAWYTYQKGMEALSDGSTGGGIEAGQALADGRVNILLLGADEKEHDAGRTDTIMVVSLDVRSGKVGVLSIPRDTRVRIPGRRGYDKINAAHAFGGPRLAMQTVEQFLDISLDYYVKLNFEGFRRLVDTLGGVEIDVKKRMKYDDYAQGLHIDLYPGKQVLNGDQALGYVRFRSDGLGDVALVDPVNGVYDGRIERQQEFVKAFARQFLQPRSLIRIPEIVSELGSMIETDMPADAMIRLGYSLKSFDRNDLETALVPGVGQKVDGVSYWVADEKRTKVLVDRLILGNDAGEGIRVQVLNGNGFSGSAQKAAALLRDGGFEVVSIGNADRFDYPRTQVVATGDISRARAVARVINDSVDPENDDEVRTGGFGTASARGLDLEVLESSDAGQLAEGTGPTTGAVAGGAGEEHPGDGQENKQAQVDVVVILGKDFGK